VKALSLCSGIGGLDYGLEVAGFHVAGMVEIDPFCRRVLDKHWPEVPKHDDIRTAVGWWRDGTPRPDVDVVAGGFPCQPHSVAGGQRGIEDERWLWEPFRDVIAAIEAPYALIENVPNLLRTGLHTVLGDLAELGFDVVWIRVPAAALGAPHLRWRLAVIAAHPDRVPVRLEPWWRGWTRRTVTAVSGFDGSEWAVAHPEGDRWGTWWAGGSAGDSTDWPDVAAAGVERLADDVANAHRATRGRGRAVADPESLGRDVGAELRERADDRGRSELGRGGCDVADTDGAGLDAGGGLGRAGAPPLGDGGRPVESGVGGGASGLSDRLDGDLTLPDWGPDWEGGLPRTARGVPDKEARLHALGNAVVPAWGAFIGSILMAHRRACLDREAAA
jgi:site-specific DNA-cytosine methylase